MSMDGRRNAEEPCGDLFKGLGDDCSVRRENAVQHRRRRRACELKFAGYDALERACETRVHIDRIDHVLGGRKREST